MPSIDERVVAMSFENQVFETRVAQTMSTLGKLDTAIKNIGRTTGLQDIEKAANKVTLQQPMSALDKLKARFGRAGGDAAYGMNEIEKAGNKVTLEGPVRALGKVQSEVGQVGRNATDGFNQIEKAGNHVSLSGVTNAIDKVQARFSVLQGAASVAIGNIASQAGQKGAAFAKSFSFGPILQGFQEYQTNLGSIQTVMANTEGQRVSGLKATNNALNELNTYSDKTIYNFSEMARNVGTFTAAGVDLKTSVASIKGIANLAALSGSSSLQASSAMYQLSQEIAAGKVGLQGWNSVVNAGMGGRKFQNSLIQTGLAMGTIDKAALKIDKSTGKATINGQSFRESIMAKPGQESWLTSDVLTSSLSTFTGDMTDAQLAAKGFTAEQIKSIQATAKSAQNAATQVKTLPQVFDVAKEAIGSGWAQTFSAIFGNFGEAKKTFTELSNFINGHISSSAKARNKMLGDWKKLGGRDVLIGGIKQAFQDLGAVLKPIREAFRDIFPAKTGKDLFKATQGFADLMKRLKPSAAVVDGLHRTFRGLFSLFSIGWYVVKKVVGVFTDLLGIAGKGGGGFLKFTGGIGDFLTAMQKAIVKGDALKGVFASITGVLRVPLELLKALGSAFAGLFGHDTSSKAASTVKNVGNISDKLKPLVGVLGHVIEFGKRAIVVMNKLFEPITAAVNKIGHAFVGIGQTVADAFKNADTTAIFSAIQTGFLGGIFLAIRKAIGGGGNFIVNPMKKLSGALSLLTGNLKAMQQAIKAHTLLAIAAAIGILAVGILILSKIDPKRLVSALGGMATGMGELVAMLYLLDKSKGTILGLPLIGVGLIGVATAIAILAAAIKIFSTMSWTDIIKGLVGVGGALLSVSIGVKAMSGPQMLAVGPALVAVAIAMNLLAVAMKIFAGFSWGQIIKGIIGMGGALLALGIGMDAMGPSILVIGPGLILAAVGMTLLSGAVASFGSMDLATLAKGIIGIGAALAVIGVAIATMPPGLAVKAAGLTILALAMTGIAGAVGIMGKFDVTTIVKGILGLGGALVVMAVGLSAMIGTLPGAAALLATAVALALLAPTLGILGALPWGTILKGLAVMGGILLVLGGVGLIATEGIAALGIAIGVLGLGILAIGAGIWLIVAALIALGDASIKSTGILIAAITAFIISIPKMVIEFIKGVVVILENLAKVMPKVVVALTKILEQLIQVVINSTPKLAQAIIVLLGAFIKIIDTKAGPLFDAGTRLFLHFLTGIANNISKVVTQAALIVIRFLNALAAKAPDLTAAGARALVAFLKGIGDHIGSVIAAGARIIVKFLEGVTRNLPHIVGGVAKMIVAFLGAVAAKIPRIVLAGVNLAGKFIGAVAKGLVKLADKGAQALIDFLNGIADVIRRREREIIDAGANIATAIVAGFSNGISDIPGILAKAITGVGDESASQAHAGNMALAAQMAANDRKWNKRHPHHKKHSVVTDVGSGQNLVDIANQNSARRRRRRHGKMGVKGVAITVGPDGKVVSSPDQLLAPVQKMAANQPPEAVKAGENVMGGLSAGIQKGLPATTKTMVAAAQSIVAVPQATVQAEAKPAYERFAWLGQNLVRGMRAGLLGMAGAMQGSVTGPIRALLAKNGDLRAFGQFLGGEFRQGLTGGLWTDGKSEARKQIEGAFIALKGKLGEEQQKLRDTIKADQDKLKQLLGDKNKNWNAINALRGNIANEKGLLAAAKASSRELIAGMQGEQAVLIKLAAKYEQVSAKLDEAKQKLQGLKDTRNQAIDTYIAQFSALPDIAGLLDSAMADAALTYSERWDAQRKKQDDDRKRSQIDQVANYKKALQDQIAATQKYMTTLNALRGAGLDDATYKKLLDMGTAGQEFASQLLSKGPGAIADINSLDKQLTGASTELAKNAAANLYQAGIDMAKGIVKGLQQDQKDIKDTMLGIAKSMVVALKAALGIKSPSRVFAELGRFTAQGLANGLTASSQQVQDAAGGIGNDAADALTNSLASISDRVQNSIDTDVTITPVLDLTQIQKDASQIQDLSNVVPITAAASFGQAAAISQQSQEAAAAQADAGTPQKVIEVNLEQINTSPKALDNIEIYRQTNNQLSQVKSALGLVT